MSVVFLATSRGDIVTPFPFSSKTLHMENYVYFLWEHAVRIVLFHVIHVESRSYQTFFKFMFWWQVIDTIDYLLTYNDIWFNIYYIPASANTVGFFIGALILGFQLWKKK